MVNMIQPTLDAIDRKILYELDKNSRASCSQIAKATRIKQETARYRINYLLKAGVIQKFLTILNTKKLGYSYYKIYLNLQKINEEKNNAIFAFLQKYPRVTWLAELEGSFDIGCILDAKNQAELEWFIHELYAQYGSFIMKKLISINLQAEFFSREYLVGRERKMNSSPIYRAQQDFISLDKKDTQICLLLAENARISAVEMGRSLSLSPDAILQRMKKLIAQKIIIGHTLVLNNEALNQYHYKIIVYIADVSSLSKLRAFVQSNNRVISLVNVFSEWDCEIDLEVQNPREVKEFLMEMMNHIPVRDYSIFHVIKIHKFSFFPQ